MAKPERPKLGEILIEQKLLTREALETALNEQKESPRKLGRVRRLGRLLVDKGFVREEKVAEALAHQLELPYVDLRHFTIKPEVTTKLPETQARRFRAIVLEDLGKAYRVGMSDPSDLNAYDELARTLQREIQIAVVTDSQLVATIDRVYRRTGEITGFARELGAAIGDTKPEYRGV